MVTFRSGLRKMPLFSEEDNVWGYYGNLTEITKNLPRPWHRSTNFHVIIILNF